MANTKLFMKSSLTSGIHELLKSYKPGQLITICKDVFRIRKNTSDYTDCYMCNLNLQQKKTMVWVLHSSLTSMLF